MGFAGHNAFSMKLRSIFTCLLESHITIDTKHERMALKGKMLVIVINILFIEIQSG